MHEKEKNKSRKQSEIRDYIKAVAVFIVSVAIALVIFFVCGQRSIENNARQTVMVNVSRQSEHLKTVFDVHYQYLNSIAEEMGKTGDLLCERNMEMIVSMCRQTDLERVALVEPDGTSHYDNGETKNVSHRKYFLEAVNGTQTLSDPLESSVDGETRVILGVPVWCDGEVIGVLGGSYNVTAISHFLFNDMFGGVGYSLIVNQDGDIIAYDGDPAYHHITYGDNFFEFYRDKEAVGDTDFADVREDFTNTRSGVIRIQNPGSISSRQYLAYAPLGINNWMICYILPSSVARERYRFFESYEYIFAGCFIILVCLMILYIVRKNNQENEELVYTAQRDALTGLFNKQYTEEFINQVLEDQQSPQLHAFLIMDVDKFKSVNDTYGHAVGDIVLEQFGKLLKSHFRGYDIVGRIGGDEFAVLMKNVGTKETAYARVDEFVKKVRDLKYEEMDGKGVTTSIGLAFAYEDGDCYMDLYKAADVELYQAKKIGGDGFYIREKKEK